MVLCFSGQCDACWFDVCNKTLYNIRILNKISVSSKTRILERLLCSELLRQFWRTCCVFACSSQNNVWALMCVVIDIIVLVSVPQCWIGCVCVPHVFVDRLIAINVSQIMLGSVQIQIEILKGWCTADIWKVKSNVSSVGPSSERNLEDSSLTKGLYARNVINFAFHIGSTPTFLYFNVSQPGCHMLIMHHELFLSMRLTTEEYYF